VEAVEALPACFHSSVHSALEVNFKKLLKVLLNHNIVIQKHNLQKPHHHIWTRVSEKNIFPWFNDTRGAESSTGLMLQSTTKLILVQV
jgi:hypothetical protein